MSVISLDHRSEAVVVLAVDRPPANALDRGLLEEVVSVVDGIAAEPPGALVMTGRDGFFSAGADLKAVPTYGPEDQAAMVHGINAMALGVYALPCPVVAAVNGHAIAGGLVLALCADIRIAATAGRYGLTEVKAGVPYPQAAIGLVRAELAPPAARLLGLGNALYDAHECHRLGVFDEVTEPDGVLPRALAVAEELAAMPAAVYARTKRDLRGAAIAHLREAIAHDPLLERWVS